MRWIVVGLLAWVGGCTTVLIPPRDVSHPETVVVTDYGRHSSILLPSPRGGLVEFAFGDEAWFALNRTTFWTGLRAMVHSPQSTLGRRRIFDTADDPKLAEHIAAERVERLNVEAWRVDKLRESLQRRFDAHLDGVITTPANPMAFVPDDETYWMFHNCNHVTAGWLRELGVRTIGLCALSDFRVWLPCRHAKHSPSFPTTQAAEST